ncbi:MAG: hypothetical protein GF320_21310 [Armatimonadia bacterium]|nr:hypothetical protein [Armatimonadia bacterium]
METSTRRVLWLLLMVAACVALVMGCAVSPGTPDDDDGGSNVPLEEPQETAYNAKMPSGTVTAGSEESKTTVNTMAQNMGGDDGGLGMTPEEARQYATALSATVEANPGDASAHLGLAMASMVLATEDVANTLGSDALTQGWARALVDPSADGPTPAAVESSKLLIDMAKGERVLPTAPVSARQFGDITLDDLTPTQAWMAADVLLAWLGSESENKGIIGRLAGLTDVEGTIVVVTIDGEEIEVESYMIESFLAGLHTIRAFLLSTTAYDPDWGDFDPMSLDPLFSYIGGDDDMGDDGASASETNTSIDSYDKNGDGWITPDEYLPADPFATLKSGGATRLAAAKGSLKLAADHLRSAQPSLATSELIPPEEQEDVDWQELLGWLDTLEKLLDGTADMVIETVDFGPETGCGTKTQSTLRMTLQPFFAGSVTDLKDLLPRLQKSGEYWMPAQPADNTLSGMFPDGMPDLMKMGIATDDGEVGFQGSIGKILSIDGHAAEEPNWDPYLASLVAMPDPADPGETVTVVATACDPDGDALTYEWDVDGPVESIQPSGATLTFDVSEASVTSRQMAFVSVRIVDGNDGDAWGGVWVTLNMP